MKNSVRHVLGISGGKDSAALAIYMKRNYPHLPIEYYFCDTGKELDDTYALIERLESYLGKKVTRLEAAKDSNKDPFDHYFNLFGGYLPSPTARWCTKKLKIEPFEDFVGNDPVISYVGIRGDEDREGYVSTKPNIQSIFPFRKNIWSNDVTSKLLANANIAFLKTQYEQRISADRLERFITIITEKVTKEFTNEQKLKALLNLDTVAFNHVVFEFLKTTSYPLAKAEGFELLNNEDVLKLEDIVGLLNETVGMPNYYTKLPFDSNGETGQYARSRSGCFFCFYQQRIEWIWLYEQHPDLFAKAMQYENDKEGFTWNQNESLQDLTEPRRMEQIKAEYLRRTKNEKPKSNKLVNILTNLDDEGCIACFV